MDKILGAVEAEQESRAGVALRDPWGRERAQRCVWGGLPDLESLAQKGDSVQGGNGEPRPLLCRGGRQADPGREAPWQQ